MPVLETVSDYPGREANRVLVGTTVLPRGYVHVSARDEDDYTVLHFTPKRARKLARQIIKAADRAERG